MKIPKSFLLLLVAVPLSSSGQGTAEGLFHGTVSINQRFVDVAGSDQKYRELFNLEGGPSASFDLFGKPAAPAFVDSYSANFYGIGSDPYSGGQFRMGKANRWDVRFNYRESPYFWDRNDDAVHPAGLHGLTTNHSWNAERRFSSVHLNTWTTPNLRLTFDYGRNTRSGIQSTTHVVDYFGAAGTFTAFQRANPYVVGTVLSEPGNVDEELNRFTGGFSYTSRLWNIFYTAGYQQSTGQLTLANLETPQRSINIDDSATARELLTTAQWNQFRRLRTPISEFSYTGQPARRLRLRGSYIFYSYRGPAELDAAFTGLARTNATGTVVAPYSITESDRVTVKEPNNVIDQGVTIYAHSKLNLLADYRYSSSTIHSDGSFQGTNNGVTTTGTVDSEWKYRLNQLDIALEFLPRRDLTIRGGIRLIDRDISVEADGVEDPRATAQSNIVVPLGSIAYRPSDRLSLRAEFQTSNNGTPYTRISPRTDRIFRSNGTFKITDKLALDANSYFRDGEYEATQFENSFRSAGATLTYSVADPLDLFGGFVYDSFFATASVTFLRGTPPLNASWRDQTINRIWQAGIDASPIRGLDLRVSGNYVRTTGVGEISGEPPIAGPLTWPMVTGTASYNFPKIGRLAVDLQRTYYIEELMTGDNFSANILSLRWRKDF